MTKPEGMLVFASRDVGVSLLKYLLEQKAPIRRLIVGELRDQALLELAQQHRIPAEVFSKRIQTKLVREKKTYVWILNLWSPSILSKQVLALAKHRLNVHPGLESSLGSHSATWMIRKKLRLGVSLLEMVSQVDRGDLYAQRCFDMKFPVKGFELQERLKSEVVRCFMDHWPAIYAGKLKAKPQKLKSKIYLKQATLTDRKLRSGQKMSLDECIRWALAHDFSPHTTAQVQYPGQILNLTVNLTDAAKKAKPCPTVRSHDILMHYKHEATKHGTRGTSTIQDIKTRELEVNAIASYLRDGLKVLEVGCGNGYVAHHLIKKFQIELEAIDFSKDMVALAKKVDASKCKGNVRFQLRDILKFKPRVTYDVVFSERCLQNLLSWGDQKKALTHIAEALKSQGRFIMLESFWTGENNLNAARAELELPPVAPMWHNVFFDEAQTKAHLQSLGLRYDHQNCFASGYYFGSRVAYPSLLQNGKKAKFSSVLNDYFCDFPPYGDFCPFKIMVFKKT